MILSDIKINEQYALKEINWIKNEKSDLCNYINFYLHDKINDKEYESLYRVCDPDNGNNFTLVSIDYGWSIASDIFILVEQKLTEAVKATLKPYKELSEQAKQKAYNDYVEYMQNEHAGEIILDIELFELDAIDEKLLFDEQGKYII